MGRDRLRFIWGITRERLEQYRSRGVLSALGVAIGAAAIVFLTSLVQSAAAKATSGLVRLGQNRIFVAAAPQQPGAAARHRPVSLADADTIRRRVANLSHVTPLSTFSATILSCGQRHSITVKAVGPEHLVLEDQQLASGRYISDLDLKHRASVAVLGNSIAKKLRCIDKPGSFVQIGPQSYQVVGLLAARGQRWGDDLDESVHVPFATAEARYIHAGSPVSVLVSVAEGQRVPYAVEAIKRVLRHRRINSGAGDGFLVYSQTDLLDEMRGLADSLSLLTTMLLSVALVIAGIGIVNAVMTSVVERTAEIGLRRAVGATRRDIGRQFLMESLVIAAGGAVAGIVGGCLLTMGVCWAVALPTVFDQRMIVVALVASVALGLICGFWPAHKAASLTPTNALRHE